MLQKFAVNNLKSFIDVTYQPNAINLLVGINNSGKTNFCQALHFLSRTARKQTVLSSFKKQYPHLKNLYSDQHTINFNCTCDLIVHNEKLTFRYTLRLSDILKVEIEKLELSGGAFGANWVTLFENDGGGEVRLFDENSYKQGNPVDNCYMNTTSDTRYTMLSNLYDWHTKVDERVIAFRDYLASWCYYNLDEHMLRNNSFYPDAKMLDSNGANLASVLFKLKNSDEHLYRQFLKLVSKIEGRLDVLNFSTAGEQIEAQLTNEDNNRFSMSTASGGTLRFMALAYIILHNASLDNPPLTIIEEPENGLYVRYLKPLFELIDPTGAGGQYIFTSHSPYFIDLFDEHPENISLLQDKGTHSVLLKPDPVKVRKYLEEIPLGELHFREMLV